MEESFWKHVVNYEEAPWTTPFHQLEKADVSLPSPDSLIDQELTTKLWEVIHKRYFEYLSSRQIISATASCLRIFGPTPCGRKPRCYRRLPIRRGISKCSAAAARKMIGSTSRIYADDDWHWHKNFPDDPIPPHEDPPFDRDRVLPKPDYSETSRA